MLFSKDFKLHLKALDQISNQLQLDPLGIINNCDLILKWASFRFFDTNPQSLNKTLEVCLAMLIEMETQNAKLFDTDVTSFVPYLLQKSGDTKDIVRNLVKKIVSQISICHVPAKIFPLILDALNSKNSRQKAECLQLADTFLEYFGLNICANPQQSLKTIAGCISERDSTARNAALNCIGTVWRKVGDRVYQMIGNIPPKEKAMLDERIKRMGRDPAPVNDEPTLRLTPKSLMNNTQTIATSEDITETPRPARSRSTSRQPSRQNDRRSVAPLNTTFASDNQMGYDNTEEVRRPNGPPKSRFSLSTQHYDPLPTFKYTPFPNIDFGLRKIDLAPEVEQQLSSSRPSSTVMPKRSESIASITSTEAGLDQVERTVSALSSIVISTVIEATNQLVYVFRDQNTNSIFLIEKADLIAKTSATQLSIIRTQHLVDRESDNDTNDLMRSLCNFLTFFMHQKTAVSQISHTTIKLLISELLRLICDERISHLPDHPHIVRSVNVIAVKLCDNSEINECFCALLHLLDSYVSTEAPLKCIELLLKCIFKHSESFLQPEHGSIQIDRMVTELDLIFNKYYTKQASGTMKRVIDSLKLVTQRLASVTYKELDPYLTLIKRDGFLYSYLVSCMHKLQETSQNENVPPKKPEKTLEEMFAHIQDTIATGGLTELFFYLEAHPEQQPEFDRLLDLCPIPAMVQYCFDEFIACRNANNPKSFHQIYAELAGAASVPVSARSTNGQRLNGNILEKHDVSLPFSIGSPVTSSSSSNGRLQSTPLHNTSIRPNSPKFSPIPSQEITNYKKRLSSLRLNQH
uniref:TOG domain-containing protein n=1 Tax=Panagrolaimus superbus TaxID=310955 RepID=A0A914YW63_9BILA